MCALRSAGERGARQIGWWAGQNSTPDNGTSYRAQPQCGTLRGVFLPERVSDPIRPDGVRLIEASMEADYMYLFDSCLQDTLSDTVVFRCMNCGFCHCYKAPQSRYKYQLSSIAPCKLVGSTTSRASGHSIITVNAPLCFIVVVCFLF